MTLLNAGQVVTLPEPSLLDGSDNSCLPVCTELCEAEISLATLCRSDVDDASSLTPVPEQADAISPALTTANGNSTSPAVDNLSDWSDLDWATNLDDEDDPIAATNSPVAPLFPTQNTFGDSYGALKACVELPCLTEFEQETLPACVDPLDFFFGDAADLLQSSPADTTTLSDQPDENWLAVDHETLNTYLETLLDIDLCCSTTSTDFPSPTAKNTDTLERQPILNTHVPPSSIQYRLSPLSPLSPPFDYPSPSGPIDVHQIYANILSTKPVADGTFFCPIPTCGRSFVRRYNLKTHFAAAHCSIREYNCTMCERRPFSRKFDLHRHMELKHNQASVSPRHQHRKRSNVVVAPPPSPASTADANDDFDDCPLSSKSGKRKNCEAAAVSNPPPKKSRSQASCTRCRSSK